MAEKVIIFDASSLISITMNGLLHELKELKKIFNGKFIITEDVKVEIIDRAIAIKRFELDGLKLKELLDTGVLELPSSLGVNNKEIIEKTKQIMETANGIFVSKEGEIKLIHLGESSCMALSSILTERKIHHVISIDERTNRMLIEKPENLKFLLERKMHTKVKLIKENFKYFKGFKVIRSSELMYVAWKKGIMRLKGPQVLDALLYALKFKGCSISNEEIKEIKALP